MDEWHKAQMYEKDWWGSCQNTLGEDIKQMALAPYMGLKIVPDVKTPYRIPLNGQSVLDIGGGCSSLLLKCENVDGTVVDPCDFPEWVYDRYIYAGIDYMICKGEDLPTEMEYDEVWIYNCLQHTEDPHEIIRIARKISKIIRFFEWINIPVCEGHLHCFTSQQLEEWLGGTGKVVKLNSNGLHGEALTGIFLGDHYDTKAEKEV